MLVIADSSALVALATCGALDILTLIYEDIRVPQAVFDEVAAPDKPQGVILSSFLAERVVSVDMSRWVLAAGGLGQGAYVELLRTSSLHYGDALLAKVLTLANETGH